jgi:hypothetical protein
MIIFGLQLTARDAEENGVAGQKPARLEDARDDKNVGLDHRVDAFFVKVIAMVQDVDAARDASENRVLACDMGADPDAAIISAVFCNRACILTEHFGQIAYLSKERH